MFVKDEKIYYIDLNDGTIHEGSFLESNREGVWLRLKGYAVNTFVYSDSVEERVFKDKTSAEAGLGRLRSKMKARLLENNRFIEDILQRLGKQEGNFYISVIKEILHEKIRM